MNAELCKISEWFKANKLSLNVSKTKWELFHPSAKKISIPNILPDLFIDNVKIERETVTKFLGVLIDENLNWKSHIDYIVNKISKTIGILYNIRDFVGKHNLRLLYFAFVQSYINYASIAWASINKTKLQTLFRRQKHALRVINFKDKFTHSFSLFLDMKALNVYKLNIFNNLCLVYKSKYKTCPPSFLHLAREKPPTKYHLRSEGILYEPFCKTKQSQFSVNYRAPHLWNKLIIEKHNISHFSCLPLFQCKLKEFF